ncbi:cobalt ECF transporter T component CbiQ [Frigoriglobus tundricola]|uniref:Transmembrane component NikQ of energizing module of nickel ECF transporter n=1 Tax=Frigoriglobus tundricola TaxID=2774151 RepID=A0A6M5YW06_9BACT|nr:cobalt ECF transporter T component CbiQ [Frigoriglobus tundricola]QJW97092.1 Transmembrane component NikQ of energizing module of nickel ECF transporter [Frigoriglobus tundricola]
MTLAFRHRPIPDSPLARWDARWKLAAVAPAVCGIAVLDHLAPVAVALALGLFLLALARLPGAWVRGRLALFAFAALPFVIVLPATLDGAGWDIGPLHVSERGTVAGLAVLCRGLAVGCFALLLLGTAPLHHTVSAAHKLKVPGLLVQLTLLTYRYAFLLAEEMRRLRVAMRTRGFRAAPTRHGYRALGHATGALLVRGSDRADSVSAAMRCRGFDGRFHTLTAFRTRAADIIPFVALVAAAGALVLWDRW